MPVITIYERRSDGNLVAGFLLVAFGLAAWRGWANARAVAAALLALALAVIVGWGYWRSRPPCRLTLTPDALTWGAAAHVATILRRDDDGVLTFTRGGSRHSQWTLRLKYQPQAEGISMFGFDLDEVRRACIDQGWRFED